MYKIQNACVLRLAEVEHDQFERCSAMERGKGKKRKKPEKAATLSEVPYFEEDKDAWPESFKMDEVHTIRFVLVQMIANNYHRPVLGLCGNYQLQHNCCGFSKKP